MIFGQSPLQSNPYSSIAILLAKSQLTPIYGFGRRELPNPIFFLRHCVSSVRSIGIGTPPPLRLSYTTRGPLTWNNLFKAHARRLQLKGVRAIQSRGAYILRQHFCAHGYRVDGNRGEADWVCCERIRDRRDIFRTNIVRRGRVKFWSANLKVMWGCRDMSVGTLRMQILEWRGSSQNYHG